MLSCEPPVPSLPAVVSARPVVVEPEYAVAILNGDSASSPATVSVSNGELAVEVTVSAYLTRRV